MNEVNIIRNDKGLDFKRIEQFVKMISTKIRAKRSKLTSEDSAKRKELKEKAFEQFGISVEFKNIEDIELQIAELNKQKEVHEANIKKFTKSEKESYGYYYEVKDGSLVHKFIEENSLNNTARKEMISEVFDNAEEDLWLARDIDHAIEIYERYVKEIDSI